MSDLASMKRALLYEMERPGGGWNADRMATVALFTARVAPEPDPLLTDLARLLDDPRVPDAYAESVRAGLRETCYQLRAVADGRAA